MSQASTNKRSAMTRSAVTLGVLWTFTACGSVDEHPGAVGGNRGAAGAPIAPAPSAAAVDADVSRSATKVAPPTGSACVLSLDCPPGQYCDLAECVQECSVDEPCPDGEACSPRGRCGDPALASDDVVSLVSTGTVAVSPSSVVLTDQDDLLEITLTSSGDEPVRYRVVTDGPHLVSEVERGEFVGGAVVRIGVDAASVEHGSSAGSVMIYTTLGNLVVTAPIQSGISGRYRGTLLYDQGEVALGQTRLTLQLAEEAGALVARVDPVSSLLFPAGGYDATYGTGSYRDEHRLELGLDQYLDVGDHGPFAGRPVGRRFVLNLSDAERGILDGTFEETVYGLFPDPITLGGSIRLERDPTVESWEFQPLAVPLPEPVALQLPSVSELFSWPGTCEMPTDPIAVLEQHHAPLLRSMQDRAVPSQELATACGVALGAGAGAEPDSDLSAEACGSVPELACAVVAACEAPPVDEGGVRALGSYLLGMAAPAALVAQHHLVEGLEASMRSETAAEERTSYEAAAAAIAPVARVLLHPGVLDCLRRVDPVAAAEPPFDLGVEAAATFRAAYPALRAVGLILDLQTRIDGELDRLDRIRTEAEPVGTTDATRERAVGAFLQAVAVGVLLEEWGVAPEEVTADVRGVLTPLDHAFGQSLAGVDGLGLAEGYVPFVYRESNVATGPTNFEQKLHTAREAVARQAAVEMAYLSSAREFESNEHALLSEIEAVRQNQDDELRRLCGAGFNPDLLVDSRYWQSCGQTDGEVASLRLELERAEAERHALETLIENRARQIAVDQNALAETQGVHAETLGFISETGDQLLTLVRAETTLNAYQSAAQVAANAQVWNGGAPAAMAAAVALIEVMRGALQEQRQQLETAQTMRFEQAGAEIELIQGMAEIQRQLIDLEQLAVEQHQTVLGTLQAALQIRNALDRAQRVAENRARNLTLVERDPAGDPTFRLVRDSLAEDVSTSREDAQQQLMLAGRALEYELNRPLDGLGRAVLAVRNSGNAEELIWCLGQLFEQSVEAYGEPQEYVTTVSVRELLGIDGPRLDMATGEELSPGEQFRRLVLTPANLDASGSLRLRFSTNLQEGNGLWSTDVCNDRISSVQAQVVGDFLGDGEAELRVDLSGGAVLRACDTGELRTWSLSTDRAAVLAAGVNSWGEARPNTALFGQAVARADWELVLHTGRVAAANADLDLSAVEDITLRVVHRALARPTRPPTLDTSCLGEFG